MHGRSCFLPGLPPGLHEFDLKAAESAQQQAPLILIHIDEPDPVLVRCQVIQLADEHTAERELLLPELEGELGMTPRRMGRSSSACTPRPPPPAFRICTGLGAVVMGRWPTSMIVMLPGKAGTESLKYSRRLSFVVGTICASPVSGRC